MPTPTKPAAMMGGGGRSHLSKAALKARSRAEADTLTGSVMAEDERTKKDPVAHRQFLRLKKLLTSIGKNDAIYETGINRYCILYSECADLETDRSRLAREMDTLESAKESGSLEYEDYAKYRMKLFDQKMALERAITSKRKALFDLERESLMTVASALRSIPKKPDDDAFDDPMSALLKQRGV